MKQGNERQDKIHCLLVELLSAEGKRQEEVLIALSKFKKLPHRKYINKWLNSDNLTIKEFFYFKILRQSDKRWEKIIAAGLQKEKEEGLKLTILSSLQSIRVKPLFDIVFQLALDGQSFKVRTLAASVLRKNKLRHHISWIVAKEKKSSDQTKIFIFLLLAFFPEETVAFDLLKDNFIKLNNPKIKLSAIEYLGRLGGEQVIPFLTDIIKNDDDYAYAATISLTYCITPERLSLLNNILTLNLNKRQLCVEVVLRFILRFPVHYAVPGCFDQSIERLIYCVSEDVRYLAIRCFGRLERKDTVEKLLSIIRDEPNTKIKKGALKTLIEFLNYRLDDLISLLYMGANDQKWMPIINKIFRQVIKTNSSSGISSVLLKIICDRVTQNKKIFNIKSFRFLVLLRYQAMGHKTSFLKFLSSRDWNDTQLWVLMKIINATDIYSLNTLNVDFMANQYDRSSQETKKEYFKFFAKMKVKSQAIQDMIFKDFDNDQPQQLVQERNKMLSGWINQAMEAKA